MSDQPGFAKRAGSIMTQAGLYTLVEDMAKVVDRQTIQLTEIQALCERIIKTLDRDGSSSYF